MDIGSLCQLKAGWRPGQGFQVVRQPFTQAVWSDFQCVNPQARDGRLQVNGLEGSRLLTEQAAHIIQEKRRDR